MIHTPTVLVLGAGASMPYDFPSGAELRDRICNATDTKNQIAEVLRDILKFDSGEIKDFARIFRDSNLPSIDRFLLRRPEFNAIGKFAIAADLCLIESPDKLDLNNSKEHWYRYLWDRMTTDANSPQALIGNQLKIVTFNYDRSLERFIFNCTKNTYGISDEEAQKVCDRMAILHVYGLLGKFHYAGIADSSRAYLPHLTQKNLQIAADSIHLVPAERQNNQAFSTARAWFKWARRICFLGFGFDSVNCECLDLPSVLAEKGGREAPTIYASTFDFTEAEVFQASKSVCGDSSLKPTNGNNLRTLREIGILNS